MPPSYEDVERAIREVPGVSSASIGAVAGTGRGRLRIRLEAGHDPDDVSESVATMLKLRFGIDVDPAAIRPRPAEEVDAEPDEPLTASTASETDVETDVGADADADAEPAPAPTSDATPEPVADHTPPPAGLASAPPTPERDAPVGNGTVPPGRTARVVGFSRPSIRSLSVTADDLEVHVDVVLETDATDLRGHASGAATRKATLRAIARATLDAVEKLFPGKVKTELEGLELTHDGEDEVATVTVTFLTHEGADKLIGVSIVRADPEHGVMRATLDAVNRRVGLMVEELAVS